MKLRILYQPTRPTIEEQIQALKLRRNLAAFCRWAAHLAEGILSVRLMAGDNRIEKGGSRDSLP